MDFADSVTAYFSGESEPAIEAGGQEAGFEIAGERTVRNTLCW
jgi:hypothetical protein